MAILIDHTTRVICQGITGAYGAQHTKGCLNYGTRLVGGVTPGKGGTKDANGLPIFDTVDQAVRATGATATMIFVPPVGAADAVMEAAAAGLKLVCCITEGVPVQDMIKVRAQLDAMNTWSRVGNFHLCNWDNIVLVGPNCPGVITPGPKTGEGTDGANVFSNAGCKIGIMPGYIHTHLSASKLGKSVGIVSRSGTLTYEAVWQTSSLGFAQSTCVGIGGDPIRGLNHTDVLRMFQDDPATDAVVLIGEIGGSDEEDAAEFIKHYVTKPVAAFIAGRTAPPGRRMGHAGAIIEADGTGTADGKVSALRAVGCVIAESPADMGKAVLQAVQSRK